MEELVVYGDSIMVIREVIKLNMNYKCLEIKLHYILKCLGREFKSLKFFHILRANNMQTELMANKGVLLNYGELVCNEKMKGINWIP